MGVSSSSEWSDFYEELLDDLSLSDEKERLIKFSGESLSKAVMRLNNKRLGFLRSALKRIDFNSGVHLFSHLVNSDFMLGGFSLRKKIDDFKRFLRYCSIDSLAGMIGLKITKDGLEDCLTPGSINKALLLYYLREYFDDFFKELGVAVSTAKDFFKDLVVVESFGVEITESKRTASYMDKIVYFSLPSLYVYSFYLFSDNEKDKRVAEASLLSIIAHELSHDIKFEVRGEIDDFYSECVSFFHDFRRLLQTFRGVDVDGLNSFFLYLSKAFMSMELVEALEKQEVFFKKAVKGVDNERLIIDFLHWLASFLENLYFVKIMVTEFPAIAIGFLYLIFYYHERFDEREVVDKIKEVYIIHDKPIRSYLKHLLGFGKSRYKYFGLFRFKKFKQFFKKHGFNKLGDVALFMEEVNNIKGFPGIRAEWRQRTQRIVKVLRKIPPAEGKKKEYDECIRRLSS